MIVYKLYIEVKKDKGEGEGEREGRTTMSEGENKSHIVWQPVVRFALVAPTTFLLTHAFGYYNDNAGRTNVDSVSKSSTKTG